MNLAFLDPILRTAVPEQLVESLDDGGSYRVTCIALNRTGTYLAAGGHDGRLVVWDFNTKSIVKLLIGHVRPLSAVRGSWSRSGRHLATVAWDGVLRIWDMLTSTFVLSKTFDSYLLSVQLDPSGRSLVLVSQFLDQPTLIDYTTNEVYQLPCDLPEAESSACNYIASFNADGSRIYVGAHDGQILFFDTTTRKKLGSFQVSQLRVGVKAFEFSRDGTQFIVNCSDKTIRLYNCDDHSLSQTFMDPVGKLHWKCMAFLGEDHVIGGYAEKAEHKIFIFSRIYGNLVKTIEGAQETVLGLVWHPARNVIVSYSSVGVLYVWGRQLTENWSAYAPGFRELEENEDYVEKEDEFDQPDVEQEKAKKESEMNEEDLDISISANAKNDLLAEDYEPDFVIPSVPIPEALYIPEAFKSPLVLMTGPKGKRRKGNT